MRWTSRQFRSYNDLRDRCSASSRLYKVSVALALTRAASHRLRKLCSTKPRVDEIPLSVGCLYEREKHIDPTLSISLYSSKCQLGHTLLPPLS